MRIFRRGDREHAQLRAELEEAGGGANMEAEADAGAKAGAEAEADAGAEAGGVAIAVSVVAGDAVLLWWRRKLGAGESGALALYVVDQRRRGWGGAVREFAAVSNAERELAGGARGARGTLCRATRVAAAAYVLQEVVWLATTTTTTTTGYGGELARLRLLTRLLRTYYGGGTPESVRRKVWLWAPHMQLVDLAAGDPRLRLRRALQLRLLT